jgi:hypothetical protein
MPTVSPPPSRHDLLLAAAVTLALAVGVDPVMSCDGAEMAPAGRCLWTVAFDPTACAGREPFFWTPAFPLLSGLLSLVMNPRVAAHVAAAGVVGMLVLPLASIGRRLGGRSAGLVAAALLVAVPAVRDLVSDPTGRGLALLGILAAAAVAAGIRDPGARPMRRGLLTGALLGVAILSRREALAPAGLLMLGLVPLAPRVALAAVGGAAAMIAPWMAILSIAARSPRIGGRSWEAATFAWDTVLPHYWLLMDVSMGSWGAPLRQAVSKAGASGSLANFEPSSLGAWLRFALPVAVPAWLAVLGVGGLVVLARHPHRRLALTGVLALGLPALPLAIIPNARIGGHPAQNLHPTVLATLILAALALGWLAKRWEGSEGWTRAAKAAVAAAALMVASLANERWVNLVVPPPLAPNEVLHTVAMGLDDTNGPVAASLSSASAVHMAGLPRARLPAPWMAHLWDAGQPDDIALLLTEPDLPGARRTIAILSQRRGLSISKAWRDGPVWAVLFVRDPPTEVPDEAQ